MKNFAKLLLYFSICFLVIFLAATGLRFLSLRVDWAKNLPPKPETSLTLLITAAHWALCLTLFSSVLLAMNYAGRRKYSAIMTIISIMCLSLFFCLGSTIALENWKSVPPAQSTGIPLGGKGLILSNSLNRNETAVILLEGTAQPLGPRVIAIPDQSLVYHETAGGAAGGASALNSGTHSAVSGAYSESIILPPVPFTDNTPWFLKSLSIDIRLNAEMLQKKLNEGLIPFLIYAGSIIFLLCSLGNAIKFSVWPMANFFLGILAFRGILAIETFLNSPEMQEIIDSFLNGRMPVTLPVAMAVPLLFFGFGVLFHLYSGLTFIVKRQDNEDN